MEKKESYREIERKFRVMSPDNRGLADVGLQVEATLLWMNKAYRVLPKCETRDIYWIPPLASELHFVRLRDSAGQGRNGEYKVLKELTVKQQDKGHNFNRLEINLEINSVASASELLERLMGQGPRAELIKDEMIYFIEDGTVISVCRVHSHSQELFIEVEAPTGDAVNAYSDELKKGLALEREGRSFFELFVSPRASLAPPEIYSL